MSKSKLLQEAVKKLGKPKDSPKTNFKKAFDDYDKQIKRKKDKKSNFEKAFDDYDKQIKRKKNIKEIKKAAVPAALGTAGGTAGGTYVAKNKKKAGGAIKAMKKGGMAMADRAGTRAMDPRMAMAMDARRRQAAMGGMKKGGSVKNELEELGRVDAEKAYTKKGKRNLKSEKKRVVNEIKKKGMKKGGMVSSASKRADGIAKRGRTRGKMV